MSDKEITTTIYQALKEISAQMQLHSGTVSLVDFKNGVAYIKLTGACTGCSVSACGVMANFEQRLKSAVPKVSKVVVL